jgi:cytochrome c oxidase subunit 1
MFTMHATTMIFLFVMPVTTGIANYIVPLQIGARDVAFPRLNAFGFWTFLAGGLFLNSSWLLGGAPDGGWFMYAPNSSVPFSPSHGIDFWALGLQITGIASLTGAINLIVTIINMRAPGMSLMKMPVFTWMALVVQFLLVFAIPVITVALFLLMFERELRRHVLRRQRRRRPTAVAAPVLDLRPSGGVHPDLALVRHRLGGPPGLLPQAAVRLSAGRVLRRRDRFLGLGVWAHHMFASGLGPVSVAVFAISTMAIAIPTGVKIVNWTMTMWGGKLWFTTSMLFAIGLIVQFTIGGLSA